MAIILCYYAWIKDWFIALCGLVVLMALQEHPDIRGSVLEIPGLNFFNILLASIVLAFLANVQKKLTGWNTPVHIKAGFMIYLLVIFISILRLLLDPAG